MGENVTTIVQNGESLGLYAKMYGCSAEEISKLNPGKIGKNGKIKEGEVLIIPIGKQPQKTEKKDRTTMEEKLNYFNDKLEEAKMKIYDPKLSSAEREKYEQEYINLLNMKKQRAETAEIVLSKDGMHFELKLKKDITIANFRELFPEVIKNFKDYSDETNQTRYENGKGFIRDPEEITLYEGSEFTLKTQEYAYQGFFSELGTSISKTLGIGEFDR